MGKEKNLDLPEGVGIRKNITPTIFGFYTEVSNERWRGTSYKE